MDMCHGVLQISNGLEVLAVECWKIERSQRLRENKRIEKQMVMTEECKAYISRSGRVDRVLKGGPATWPARTGLGRQGPTIDRQVVGWGGRRFGSNGIGRVGRVYGFVGQTFKNNNLVFVAIGKMSRWLDTWAHTH